MEAKQPLRGSLLQAILQLAQIWENDEPTIVDGHVTVVRADKNKIDVNYFGLNLTGREAEVEALGEGSTGQTELARSRLASFPILTPAMPIQVRFGEIAQPLVALMTENDSEARTLSATRDLLLPKLMSGEIRVRDAERIVEAAA